MSVYLNTADSDKTDEAIITPAAGKKIHVMGAKIKNPISATTNAGTGDLRVDSNGNVWFQSGGSTSWSSIEASFFPNAYY